MLNIQYAKNPIWNDETGNAIHLTVKFEEIAEELPFLATSYDTMEHGLELFNRAKAGEFGEVLPYVPPAPMPIASNQPSTNGTVSA